MNKPIKRAFLDTEDGQILYRISGEGNPLLLLHQNFRSGDEFRELIPILTQNRLVIAMDLLGLGDSDKPPRMYSIEDYAKTVILLLDELGIKTTSILGNHTGACIAAEVAAAYPERVEKIILCNIDNFSEEAKAALSKKFENLNIQEDGSHLMQRWLARANYVGFAELNHRWILDDLKCFGYPWYAPFAVIDYCQRMEARLRLIKSPTLILSGTEDVKQLEKLGFANADNREFILTAIPHSHFIDIEGGTICMMNQMPEEIAKVVIDFLE
ncbi:MULTISPECIES: alpha/beta hydrolase [unclassified Nodularia (in: cyanobacteria)]|uniref:alpha/beta fold hydrolase n=1 Tax=unclassified Nodularia (in: cyanobacteria) TaxID=2656917 RepID=UPI001880056D|nr:MULTISPECIES: alpha/beta hydrolase [unclassified Nodularia (in: cyanobacteria)]MBE9198898.1 alpha/beta hydrolase [Nodularia sp. LEGE 06071]MCC2692676.1 alpha/beta hydrolase [Nodularia sp. LEGE 04288]